MGERQAEDIMDEQHYCIDWTNVKCYIEDRSEWRAVIWRADNPLPRI